jgi:hypothetical protein
LPKRAFSALAWRTFWVELLNKFVVICSTVKPFEKSQPEGSEDPVADKPPMQW